MRTFLRLSLLAVVAAVVFGACQKVETYQPGPDNAGKALIHFELGIADDDYTSMSSGDVYSALPEDVKGWLYCTYGDLGVAGNTDEYAIEITFSGSELDVEVPVAKNGTTYQFRFNEFIAEKTYSSGGSKTKENVHFSDVQTLYGNLDNLKPGAERYVKLLFVAPSNTGEGVTY